MTENPLAKVIERLARMAQMHGIVFCKITWDAEADMFDFTPILAEHVTVHYGEKGHD